VGREARDAAFTFRTQKIYRQRSAQPATNIRMKEKPTCRGHIKSPQNPLLMRVWPLARDEKVTLDVLNKFNSLHVILSPGFLRFLDLLGLQCSHKIVKS
jgi:hypothetical protein